MDTRIEALAGDILDRAAKDDMRYLVGKPRLRNQIIESPY